MKRYPLGLAVIGVSAVLTGCGSQADCSSSDVQETYLGMVGSLNDQDAVEILKSSVFKSVITKDVDKDTGYRSCTAKIVMEGEVRTRERNISYQIEQIESGDANFEVYADRTDLGQVRYMAKALAAENRAGRKTKELIDAAEENPYVLATEQDAREAGIAVGHRFLGDRVEESSVRVTSLDIDGDSVLEFMTAMKIYYASGDSEWITFTSFQVPTGPGQKNVVQFAGEGAIVTLGMEPSSYEVQGKNLVVTMADGSKRSLTYHASTEAYRAYIKANGGNPSAPITPSAMSVATAQGVVPTTAPTAGAALGAGVIEAAIAAQIKQDGGSENAEVRNSVEGDVNGDGTPDVAVLYSLKGVGGSNRSVNYLAAFVREAGQLKLADTLSVGGFGSSAKSMSLEEDGAVLLTLLEQDSSVEEEVVYMLNEGKWLFIPVQP